MPKVELPYNEEGMNMAKDIKPKAEAVGGTVDFGDGCTLTTLNIYGGSVTLRCNATTVNVYGGNVQLEEQSAVTTINLKGTGNVDYNSTGTIGTANLLDGGSLNCTSSGLTRTISTLKINEGTISYDPSKVTVSARSAPDDPVEDTVRRAY